jgi:hypothetical protein
MILLCIYLEIQFEQQNFNQFPNVTPVKSTNLNNGKIIFKEYFKNQIAQA